VDDYAAMSQARLKWVRELGKETSQPCPDERALAAYARGYFDALELALEIVIKRHIGNSNDDEYVGEKK